MTPTMPEESVKELAAYHRQIAQEVPLSESAWHLTMAEMLDPPPPHVSLHERLKNAIANTYIDSKPDTPPNEVAKRAAAKALVIVEAALSTLECANCSHPTDASASGCYVSNFRQKTIDLLAERMQT